MISQVSTAEIKDYLKSIITECKQWYIGKIDKNKENAIAIYANRRQIDDNSKYKRLKTYGILPITLLLRWTKNYNTAEKMANQIYELLDCSSFLIGDYRCSAECLYNGPIDLGADENNIYEFSIELNLLYRKGENNGN